MVSVESSTRFISLVLMGSALLLLLGVALGPPDLGLDPAKPGELLSEAEELRDLRAEAVSCPGRTILVPSFSSISSTRICYSSV